MEVKTQLSFYIAPECLSTNREAAEDETVTRRMRCQEKKGRADMD